MEGMALFLREQGTIRAVVRGIAARYHLNATEIEDLSSQVAVKLVEDDYLVLRKFGGRSSLHTYLSVVVNRVFLDGRTVAWGKWHASAVARRAGPVGVRFERLTVGCGLSFEDACAILERDPGEPVDRQQLQALATRLPVRTRRHQLPLDDLTLPAAYGDPAAALITKQQAIALRRCTTVLARELDQLSPDDRRLVRRRFVEGRSVVSVARERSMDAPALYRHVARLLKELRERLEARGITKLDVTELLDEPR